MTAKKATRTHQTAIWDLEPHTKAKHQILRQYLGAWFPIMASRNKRLAFIDAFAGPGSYSNGEDGSPLIVLRTLLEHSSFGKMLDTEFVFMFLEAFEDRYDHLVDSLSRYESSLGGWPKNVHVHHQCTTFADGAQSLLESLESSNSRLAPAVVFIDPFGVSGLPMETVGRLASFPRVEVLINMMINTAKRFAGSDIISDTFDELFGTDAYQQCRDLTGEERQRFLHDLYESQLRGQGNLKYVKSFSMFNRQNQRSYYLFHGTQHIRGLEVMKDAMWKVDPAGGSEFRDTMAGELVLFDANPPFHLLQNDLLAHFAGQTVTIKVVEDWVTEHTPFKKNGHLKIPVLRPMEKDGRIWVSHYPRPTRSTLSYVDGTQITFAGNAE